MLFPLHICFYGYLCNLLSSCINPDQKVGIYLTIVFNRSLNLLKSGILFSNSYMLWCLMHQIYCRFLLIFYTKGFFIFSVLILAWCWKALDSFLKGFLVAASTWELLLVLFLTYLIVFGVTPQINFRHAFYKFGMHWFYDKYVKLGVRHIIFCDSLSWLLSILYHNYHVYLFASVKSA